MLYVIGEQRTGVVKIGTAVNPYARLREIQAGNPRPLQVLVSLPGDRIDEIGLHQAFADRCVGGEWFDFGDDDAVVAVVTASADRAMAERRPAAMVEPKARRSKRMFRDPHAAERTLRCIFDTFAAHGNPATLTTAILLDALGTGPDAERWQRMATVRTATMDLAADLRTCADARSTWIERRSVKVPAHDGTGKFVNGWHRCDLERLTGDGRKLIDSDRR